MISGSLNVDMMFLHTDKKVFVNSYELTTITIKRILFFDKRLSGDSKISCNSCHDLKNYGTNGEHYKKLREEGKTFRDVPSIYNL